MPSKNAQTILEALEQLGQVREEGKGRVGALVARIPGIKTKTPHSSCTQGVEGDASANVVNIGPHGSWRHYWE